jgi:hypothetical protein
MIIQTIPLYPSGAVWIDSASNVSRLDPSAVLHLSGSRHAEATSVVCRQIAKASSSNAIATRRVSGTSTASS